MKPVQYQAVWKGSADPARATMAEVREDLKHVTGGAPQCVIAIDPETGEVLRAHAWPVPKDWQ